MIIKAIDSSVSEDERSRWKVVRTDTFQDLKGEILEANTDSGVAKMREPGPDDIDKDGVRKPTFREVTYALGAGRIMIVRRGR